MRYKMVLSDLDGTLLRRDKSISPYTETILRKLTDAGVWFIPATGRCLSVVPDAIRRLPFLHYAICGNGSVIHDLDNRCTLYRDCLTLEETRQILEILEPLQCATDCHLNDERVIMSRCHLETLESRIPDAAVRAYMRRSRTPVEDFAAEIHSAKCIQKIHTMFYHNAERLETRERLRRIFPTLTITNSNSFNIELTSPTANKGNAMLILAEHLGISRDQTMAFGDASNDVLMLQNAGMGIAMENGEPCVLHSADCVTSTNENDGVAVAIEKILLS